MKRPVVVPVLQPPPSSPYSSCLILLISSDVFLLPANKSPPVHQERFPCLGATRIGGERGEKFGVFITQTMTLDLEGLYRADPPAVEG